MSQSEHGPLEVIQSMDDDTSSLVSAVLAGEAERARAQAQRDAPVELPDDLLPGVGEEAIGLRAVLRKGGVATLIVLMGLNIVNEFDYIAFAIFAPDIQRALDVNDFVIAISGAVGGLMVFAAAVPIGFLADRVRRTSLIGVLSAVWVACAGLTGAAQSGWQLVAARLATGVGKANEGPVQKPLLADTYPVGGRSRIFALHDSAHAIGRFGGPLLAGALATAIGGVAGWRWAFVFLAAPALLLALVAFFLREPARGSNEREAVIGAGLDAEPDDVPASFSAVFGRLRKIKTFYFFLVGYGALGFGIVSTPIFINLILERRFGLDAWGRAIVTTIVASGSVVGAMIGGRYGDRLFRRAPERSVIFIGLAIILLGITLPVSVYMPTVYWYMAVAVLQGVLTASALVPADAVIASVTPYRYRSVGFATVGLYLTLVGGVGGAVIAAGISSALNEQAAVAIVMPVAALAGGGLIIYGARFVRQDIAMTVADLREEQAQAAARRTTRTPPRLELHHVDFSYGPVQVLFDVSFTVQPGEVVALLGTNGAGKSTVARVISGLGMPDRGMVRVDGSAITFAEPTRRVKLGIAQASGGKGVFPSMTVRENLLVGAHTLAADPSKARARIDHVVEMFPQLGDRFDAPAGVLSGGQQQMLTLARALLLEPKLLIIDELSLGLAPVVVQDLFKVIDRLKDEGMTMIIVEQSVNIALSLADRALFMEKGSVRFEGPAAELAERGDLVRAVFFSTAGESG